MPKVTVLMPVHNGVKYIRQSIKSVLNQEFRDFEYLIIDDSSTDRSLNIIREYKNGDGRIRIIKNRNNLGIQKTLNKGIKLAKGKYIARVDCDDIWNCKNKLAKQVKFLEENPKYGIIGTAIILVDHTDKEIGRIKYKESDSDIRNNLLLASQLAHPSVLIRKKALRKVGFYREDKRFKHAEDYELWLRIGTKYKLANLSDYCLKYRINPEGVSLKNEFRQRLAGLRATIIYRNKYPGFLKAIMVKAATLVVPRSCLNLSIRKNKAIRKIYSRLTGVDKR